MKKPLTLLGLLGATAIAYGQPATYVKEIDYLMDYVATSECVFIRNGNEYGPKKAVDHIQRKYHHFRKEIDSAEEFITLSASKSSVSGKPYFIQCSNREPERADTWLSAALLRYRGKASN